MKRYRVFLQEWDSTGDLLNLEIRDDWEEDVKQLHRENRERMIRRLTLQYGELGIEEKIENLRAIGGQAFSIVSYHNRFYRQAREAFIVGAYYPALTAACALGERILNHLILDLRPEFTDTLGYRQVAKNESFNDWNKMTATLESWGILVDGVKEDFESLGRLRNRGAIHFDHATPDKDREMAVAALKHLDDIIAGQFGAFGAHPWFIPVAGVPLIRKEWEEHPFVRLVYLPASLPVGPHHHIEIDSESGDWTIFDEQYDEQEITDEEFVRRYDAFTQGRIAALAAQ